MTSNPAVARLHQWPVPVSMTLTGTLRFVADRAAEEVGVSAGACVNLLTTRGRRITSVATDPVAERLSALHDRFDDNPGAAAWARGAAVAVTGSNHQQPWSAWRRQAIELGAPSVLFAALCTPQRVLGTLMVYSPRPDAYRRSDEEMLDGYARDAAILIDETQSARTQFIRTAKTKR
ncbi:GAF domain-containing protein [Mycolicibacterium rutilum]|uniref:GAF domain-containing protein n=1 Tax=Mycolicibacterium rutilum TaxID=370526 RepID=A0A1H6LKA7_MYCRU|nr:GAF domain-containing protein [Mycolicibacterium rutilum]SEH89014.1 GAF domain-containing protein [Mycolicibacterium rutilum]